MALTPALSSHSSLRWGGCFGAPQSRRQAAARCDGLHGRAQHTQAHPGLGEATVSMQAGVTQHQQRVLAREPAAMASPCVRRGCLGRGGSTARTTGEPTQCGGCSSLCKCPRTVVQPLGSLATRRSHPWAHRPCARHAVGTVCRRLGMWLSTPGPGCRAWGGGLGGRTRGALVVVLGQTHTGCAEATRPLRVPAAAPGPDRGHGVGPLRFGPPALPVPPDPPFPLPNPISGSQACSSGFGTICAKSWARGWGVTLPWVGGEHPSRRWGGVGEVVPR